MHVLPFWLTEVEFTPQLARQPVCKHALMSGSWKNKSGRLTESMSPCTRGGLNAAQIQVLVAVLAWFTLPESRTVCTA